MYRTVGQKSWYKPNREFVYRYSPNIILLYIERYKTTRIGALPAAVTECERRVDGEMAVDL